MRAAGVKGLAETRVIGVHAFGNSMIPVVTFLGYDFGALLGEQLLSIAAVLVYSFVVTFVLAKVLDAGATDTGRPFFVMELVRKVTGQGITVVLIEHDMRMVMGISERIYVLDHGELIAEGAPDEIRTNSKVIEAYLGGGKLAQHH